MAGYAEYKYIGTAGVESLHAGARERRWINWDNSLHPRRKKRSRRPWWIIVDVTWDSSKMMMTVRRGDDHDAIITSRKCRPTSSDILRRRENVSRDQRPRGLLAYEGLGNGSSPFHTPSLTSSSPSISPTLFFRFSCPSFQSPLVPPLDVWGALTAPLPRPPKPFCCIWGKIHISRVRPSGSVRPVSGVCEPDCDLNFGPIFTKFGTFRTHAEEKIFEASPRNRCGQGNMTEMCKLTRRYGNYFSTP